jgi:preprotein translocase SecE subunit
MAVATTKGNEDRDPMADDDGERQLVRVDPRGKGGDDDGPEGEGGGGGSTPGPVATGGGFFSIYKSGQGYWTRMVTGAAAALLLALICHWLYTQVLSRWAKVEKSTEFGLTVPVRVGIVAGFAVAILVVVWRQLNKPRVVDFLIATESEMKKVNWTDRKALIGSTKVVIIFMFLIAIILFLFDVLFGFIFFGIGILKHKPF